MTFSYSQSGYNDLFDLSARYMKLAEGTLN